VVVVLLLLVTVTPSSIVSDWMVFRGDPRTYCEDACEVECADDVVGGQPGCQH
jgi:hypothetical protein